MSAIGGKADIQPTTTFCAIVASLFEGVRTKAEEEIAENADNDFRL
jgi:hypothetical protein